MEAHELERFPSQRFNGRAIDLVLAYFLGSFIGSFIGRLVGALVLVTRDEVVLLARVTRVTGDEKVAIVFVLIAGFAWIPITIVLFIVFRAVRGARDRRWAEMDRLTTSTRERNKAEIPS
ncbi:MAG: hypothetical protein O7H41_01405 [Planctomycetota bacterium]|nr:hypothetical protein [Planctomycetota bacterium]